MKRSLLLSSCLLTTLSLGAQTIVEHVGANDPLTESFSKGGDAGVAPVVNDLGSGLDAWQHGPASSSWCCDYYWRTLTASEFSILASASQWEFTATFRNLAPATTAPYWSSGVPYSRGTYAGVSFNGVRFNLNLSADGFGNQVLSLDPYPTRSIADYTIPGLGTGYVDLRLVYDNGTNTADIFVNGAPVIFGYGGHTNFVSPVDPASVAFGGEYGHFQSVRLAAQSAPPSDSPPIANAGADFPVNEGQASVPLDGSASSDPDNDPLTYAWSQTGGTAVALSDATAANPTFTAPTVAIGGETLTFQLTVTANGVDASDTVNVSVVNVNHPPVAEAGPDQSIAEGSPVTLQGEASFDIDMDSFTYAWVQVSGTPTVTLTGADTANPTFDAPYYGTNGSPGIVGTLVFELQVDDGYPLDAPAPGYTLANVVDSVTIDITNVNNDPVAEAGVAQTRDENELVSLNGADSSDPDGDVLTYAWTQTGGTLVTIANGTTAAPSFTTPFVNAGGEDLTFELTVDDGYTGVHTDTVVIHVQNTNDPPNASGARPTLGTLWPPNHSMITIGIAGVTDPNANATITITGVTQDEPTNGTGDGDTAIDAVIKPDGTVLLRAERSGNGDGRVYTIHFTAADLEGSSAGSVTVTVPKKKKSVAVDSGQSHDSTN